MKIAKKFRINIHTLTSWGASVVILGAMAKLLRWHAADLMIVIGMATEALLFFVLGFQKEEEDEVEVASLSGTHHVVHQHAAPLPVNPAANLADAVPPAPPQVVPNPFAAAAATAQDDCVDELKRMKNNLQLLNTAYETMIANVSALENSTQNTDNLRIQITQMAQNMQALNAVYANMLAAMGKSNA